ncbi:ras association domain-containing protein 10 [Polymixia lowei]
MMESEESKISVWVCREEKLIFGLSKRTTCTDVVGALLTDPNLQQSLSAAALSEMSHLYCIVEKWRGLERILPGKTKILRLWGAWGEEQENVRFVLVKHETSLGNRGPRSAEARVVLSRESPCVFKGTARATVGFSAEKQRRIVRKAFRKLEKMNKKRTQAASKDESSAEKMETLVHLVISQDQTIRQQIQRISELDTEIEMCEAKVHFDRIKTHGVNYVQDTYLMDVSTDAPSTRGGENLFSVESLAKFEDYARQCEEVVKLQEELSAHEALMDGITAEIQEELNRRWMTRRRGALSCKYTELKTGETDPRVTPVLTPTSTDSSTPEADASTESELLLEEERVKTQLDTSLYIGLRLNADLEAIRNDLNLTQEMMEAKEKDIRDLLDKVNTLDIEEGTSSENCNHVTTKTGMMCTLKTKSEWVEQVRGLSNTCDANDDDSDTGLSSLHSQDSDPVCESLV